ncbi:MAG: hypothetical protein HYW63_02175 [Candidatus Levybacteria bacterium]|nr:hypothetical protein [Candidatus Levybacteria bacterium]
MKKIFLSFIFFLIAFSTPVYAQTEIPIPTVSTSPTPTQQLIDYQLPYPGILPGSPLYSIKMIRDRIIEFLISDPLKKADFYILQADKRVAAAILLFEKGNNSLGQTTISKGQNYLEKSLEKAMAAKNSGKDAKDVLARVKNSATKQRQEIENLSKKSNEIKRILSGDLGRVQRFEKSVEEIKP